MNGRGRVLALLGTAFFMTILDGTSLLTALPSISRDLHLGRGGAQWTVTAYALAFAGPLLLCGRAADLLGRRRVFLAGMALRVLASLLCGLAPSPGLLVAGRALQGVSAAVIAPAALSMVMNAFPEGAARNRALGVWGGLGGFGATAGLLLGGVITDTLGWQWVFWINVPVGAVVLCLAPFALTESHAAPRRLDVAGALTVTPAFVLLVYAISRSSLVALALSVACFALFVLVERRSSAPLVPFHAFSRLLIGGNLLTLLAGMTVDGMLITLTSYAQGSLGWSPATFGVAAASMTVTAVAGGLVSQRLATSYGVRRVASAGTVLLCAACAILAGAPGFLIAGLVVFGAGMGTTAVCAQIAALTGVREHDSGLAAGLSDTSFAVGTALGVAVCTTAGTAGLGFAAAGAFALTGLLVAVSLLAPPIRTSALDQDQPILQK